MVVLRLISTINESPNEKLGFVIKKNVNNPAPIVCKKIGKGTGFGYYAKGDPSTYIALFRDAPNEVSFKEHTDQKFEYMTTLQYNSPHCALKLLTEYFQSAGKKLDENDTGSNNKIIFEMIKLEGRPKSILNKLNSYIKNIHIEIEDIVHNSYKITVSNTGTIFELINYTVAILIIVSTLNTNDLYVGTDLVDRCIRSLVAIDAPYYIRYLVASRMIKRSMFKKLKSRLEESSSHKYTLNYGTTALHRQDLILNYIDLEKSVIDYGCGEGSYVKGIAPIISKKGGTYYAHDIDKDELAKAVKKAKDMNLTNVKFFDSEEELRKVAIEECTIIVSEVVEHLPPDQSVDIIANIINNYNWLRIIITTPNYEFNVNYDIEGFRHDDHKVEFTRSEFKEYMDSVFEKVHKNYSVKYIDVGDIVDGTSCSQGAIIDPSP